MFGLVLMFLLLWAVLVVFLAVGTTWFQDYIYSQPASHMYWRAPAAGSALTLFILFWAFIDSREPPGRFRALFDFSPEEGQARFKELWVPKEGKHAPYDLNRDCVRYEVKKDSGHLEYLDGSRRLPRHADPILVKENGEVVEFRAERDEQGKFKFERGQGQDVRYTDANGRVMTEGPAMGQISTFRWGLFLGNMALNLLFLAAWFACLWLILEFQWSHALGLAVVCWLVMMLLVVPPLLTRVEDQARRPGPTPTEAAGAMSTLIRAA